MAHSQASAYHAQSPVAMERFHQTLKSMLRDILYMNIDWEEGLQWLLLEAREVVQEGTGLVLMTLCLDIRCAAPWHYCRTTGRSTGRGQV